MSGIRKYNNNNKPNKKNPSDFKNSNSKFQI